MEINQPQTEGSWAKSVSLTINQQHNPNSWWPEGRATENGIVYKFSGQLTARNYNQLLHICE